MPHNVTAQEGQWATWRRLVSCSSQCCASGNKYTFHLPASKASNTSGSAPEDSQREQSGHVQE